MSQQPAGVAERPTKLSGIEAARGIAAVMVVFYHAARHMKLNIGYLPFGGFSKFGHAGVDFFFVLSGFIIFFVHAKDIGSPGGLLHYTQRRFTRIYPFYWFVLLVSVLMAMAGHAGSSLDFYTILLSATLLPNATEMFVGVAWTLQHELLFYLIFATAIVHARFGIILLAVWFSAIVAQWLFGFVPQPGPVIANLLSPFNIEFFFGMFAAWLTFRFGVAARSATIPGDKRWRASDAFLIGGILLFVSFALVEDLDLIDGYDKNARLAYGISSMLIVLGLVGIRNLSGLTGVILQKLGAASYSIYLTHFIFIGITYKIMEFSGVFNRVPTSLTYIILTAVGILGGVAMSRWVEYPLMGFVRDRIFKRKTSKVAS